MQTLQNTARWLGLNGVLANENTEQRLGNLILTKNMINRVFNQWEMFGIYPLRATHLEQGPRKKFYFCSRTGFCVYLVHDCPRELFEF